MPTAPQAVAILLASLKGSKSTRLNLKFGFENYKYSFNLWRQKFIFWQVAGKLKMAINPILLRSTKRRSNHFREVTK